MLYLPKPDAAACARSDTYFMFVLDSVAPRAALRPPSGQAAWEALLGTVACRAAKQGADTGWQLPCPACMALVHGVASAQAAHDADLDAVLTARCPSASYCITPRTAPHSARTAICALSLAHTPRFHAAVPPGVLPTELR